MGKDSQWRWEFPFIVNAKLRLSLSSTPILNDPEPKESGINPQENHAQNLPAAKNDIDSFQVTDTMYRGRPAIKLASIIKRKSVFSRSSVMKTLTWIAATFVMSLLHATGHSQETPRAPDQDPVAASQKKIKGLQKERIATLKDVVEQLTARSRAGRGELDELFEARLEVHSAELAAAEKLAERMESQKKIIDVLGEYEKYAEGRRAMARGPTSAILKIKARRLQAEIDLEQAKIKEASAAKTGA